MFLKFPKLARVPASNVLYAGTVPASNFLYAGTVPASNCYLILNMLNVHYSCRGFYSKYNNNKYLLNKVI